MYLVMIVRTFQSNKPAGRIAQVNGFPNLANGLMLNQTLHFDWLVYAQYAFLMRAMTDEKPGLPG